MKGLLGSIEISRFSVFCLLAAISFTAQAGENRIGIGADGTVKAIAVQVDGKTLLGGEFTRIHGKSRFHLARLNSDGSLDEGFTTAINFDGGIESIAIQADGKILVGGYFTRLGNSARNNLGRLNTDGSVDMAFNPSPNEAVTVLYIQQDSRILVGGLFGAISGHSGVNGLSRLNADGSFNASLNNNNINGAVPLSIVQQPDSKVIVGYMSTGNFGDENKLFRFDSGGTIDSSYNAWVTYGSVTSLALQTDGKVIISGTFTRLNNRVVSYIGRVNTNGSFDNTFMGPNMVSGYSNYIWETLLQRDGKILIGGSFNLEGENSFRAIGRLNQNGSIDSSYPATASSGVDVIVAQPDNKVLVGGAFSFLNGESRGRFGRLNLNGTLDDLFPQKGENAAAIPPIIYLLNDS